MNRNFKREGNLVFVLLCFNYSTIYMLIILPNLDIDVYIFQRKSKHTHMRVQTHTISYMHVCLQICIPINMETYPQKQLLYCLILYTCFFSG